MFAFYKSVSADSLLRESVGIFCCVFPSFKSCLDVSQNSLELRFSLFSVYSSLVLLGLAYQISNVIT